ncbi:hypothetical protein Tco_0510598 [Tanacetum coccineum]
MAERPDLDEDKGGKLIDPTRFRGMVGSLMYLSASRPDIEPFHIGSRGSEGLRLCSKKLLKMLIMQGVMTTRKKIHGSAQFLGHRLVSWSSKKQKSTAISTTEAEYIALSGCCAQILWMRSQLRDYGFVFNKIPMSKGRTVADSIAERLTRPTAYKFKTDCSIIPVWNVYYQSVAQSLKIKVFFNCKCYGGLEELHHQSFPDSNRYEHVRPKFSEWRMEEKITSNSR